MSHEALSGYRLVIDGSTSGAFFRKTLHTYVSVKMSKTLTHLSLQRALKGSKAMKTAVEAMKRFRSRIKEIIEGAPCNEQVREFSGSDYYSRAAVERVNTVVAF
jgi:hypothetical protein